MLKLSNFDIKEFLVNLWIKIILMSLILSLSSCTLPGSNNYRSPNIDYKKAALLNVELGKHYLAQGYTERAKKKFLHALDLMPNLAESHGGMGHFWEVVGEDKEAEKHYKKSINLGKGKGGFYNQYAVFLCDKNRYKEANKYFLLAINDKTYTKTAEVYNNAGICALKYNDKQQAEQYFTKALNHDPKMTNVFLDLANINIERNNFNIAKQFLENFYKQNQNKLNPNYLWLSIKLSDKLGQKDKVASLALLLKNLFPDSEEYKTYQKVYEQG